MKMKNTLLYTISIFLLLTVTTSYSQEEKTAIDSVAKPKVTHSLRFGVDVSKPILGLFKKDYSGIAFVADYRIRNNYYIATEFGLETRTFEETTFSYTTKGSFYKIGFDYNLYENLIGMNNMIYVGLRYGRSDFSHEILSYTTNTSNQYWNSASHSGTTYNNLNASWATVLLGLKAETFKNVFIGASLQINRLLSQKQPDGFQNLYAPGYNRIGLNDLSAGFNYTISYMIPLTKKKQAVDE